MPQPVYIAETQAVRRLAADPRCRWVWTKHFFDEAIKENPLITQPDVEEALKHGTVILEETAKQDILWRVKGKDLDLRSIVVVIALFEKLKKIKVVTVWVPKGR